MCVCVSCHFESLITLYTFMCSSKTKLTFGIWKWKELDLQSVSSRHTQSQLSKYSKHTDSYCSSDWELGTTMVWWILSGFHVYGRGWLTTYDVGSQVGLALHDWTAFDWVIMFESFNFYEV